MITTRCQFLQGLAPTAGVLAAPNLLRAANLKSRLHHACVGVGGMMGYTDLQLFNQNPLTDVVAIFDNDEADIQRALKEASNARVYRDWGEMLAKEGDKIDSLNASVSNHMQASGRDRQNQARFPIF